MAQNERPEIEKEIPSDDQPGKEKPDMVPEQNPVQQPEIKPDVSENPDSDNTARPPGDWQVERPPEVSPATSDGMHAPDDTLPGSGPTTSAD